MTMCSSISTVSRPISHSLSPELESGLFGSPVDGGCSSTSGINNEICDGTSVLNDGILPALIGVSNDSASQWASELFTMRRSGTDPIAVSLELPSGTYNQVELAVFNCPQWQSLFSGLDHWTGLLYWNTGLTFDPKHSGFI